MSDPESVTSAPTAESPFVGLTHFTEEYSDRFFGRDAQIAIIVGNLSAARLTLLYAESGVGKSSLLRAGVAARLRGHAARDAEVRGSPRRVPVVFSSWTDQPVAALVDAIEAEIRPYVGDRELDLPRDRLREAIQAASAAIDATLLVILDQFEEYFLYRAGAEGHGGLADQVAECVNDPNLRANFLISIREDAYAGLGDLFRGRIANVYANFLHLDYLDPAEAREAITKPIERINDLLDGAEAYEIEPELVDAVLTQVRRGRFAGDENGQGPTGADADDSAQIETTYLQLVMKRLWDEETASGSHRLRVETLNGLGGAQKIIGTHLDRSMSALSAEEQSAAASLFRFLVTRAGTKIALTASDLSELSEVPEPLADAVLRRLAAGDLHILRPVAPRDGRGDVSYEIFHDALARPIVEWRARKDKEELAARVERERAAKEAAQQVASEAEEREARERRRKRLALTGVAVLGVGVLVLAGVLAIVQGNLADERRKSSESAQAATRIMELAGSPTFDLSAAALASLEAYRLWPTFEARRATLYALGQNVGRPRVAAGHTRAVNAVAYWPESSRLASGGFDGTIRLWDGDGAPLASLIAPGGSVVNGVAVSAVRPDGSRTLAAALSDGRIAVWDVADPAQPVRLAVLDGLAEGPANAVAFHPERPELLAAAGDDGAVRLWDLGRADAGRELDSVGADGRVTDLAFGPGGDVLLAGGRGGVSGWFVDGAGFSGETSFTESPTTDVAVASNESYAYTASGGAQGYGIHVYDAAHERGLFLPTTDVVHSITFADDGATLVSVGGDWQLTTWDVEAGRPYGPPRTHGFNLPIWDVAASDDGTTVASGGDDRNVKFWPLDDPGPLASTVGAVSAQESNGTLPESDTIAVSSSGYVAAAAGAAGAFIWSLEGPQDTDASVEPLTHFRPASDAVAVDGETLAVARRGAFDLWDTGEGCERMPEHPCLVGRSADPAAQSDWISSLAFGRSGDTHLLASGGYDGSLSLWDATPEDGRLEQLWEAPQTLRKQVNQVAFSPTDPLLAVAAEDGTVQLWDVTDPSEPVALGDPLVEHERQPVTALAFSPDGSKLVSGGLDQQVVFHDVTAEDEGPAVERTPGTIYLSNSILALAFSPDGETLGVGDGDASLCLYDVESRRSVGSCPQGHDGITTGAIDAVQFAPDGTAVLTAGRGNPVVAWDEMLWDQGEDEETVESLTAEVCALAGRNLTQDEWDAAFVDTELEGERRQTCEEHPLP